VACISTPIFTGNSLWLHGYEAPTTATLCDDLGVRQAAPVSSHSFRGNNELTKFVTRKVNLLCKARVQSS
jgi:hypothetical protein